MALMALDTVSPLFSIKPLDRVSGSFSETQMGSFLSDSLLCLSMSFKIKSECHTSVFIVAPSLHSLGFCVLNKLSSAPQGLCTACAHHLKCSFLNSSQGQPLSYTSGHGSESSSSGRPLWTTPLQTPHRVPHWNSVSCISLLFFIFLKPVMKSLDYGLFTACSWGLAPLEDQVLSCWARLSGSTGLLSGTY